MFIARLLRWIGDAQSKDERGGRDPTESELFFRDFGTARLAVAHQAVEMHPDVGGFGGSAGERDSAVECHAGFVIAAELHQEGTAHTEEMKIIRKPLSQRLDQFERRFGP